MITIKPLQTDQAQLFTAYFDGLDFSHAEHWAGCFCQYYLSGCTPEEWEAARTVLRRYEGYLEQKLNGLWQTPEKK